MRRTSSGFSLIEMMIAITLGLVISSAVVAVFIASRNVYMATSSTGAATDGGRFGLNFIEASARTAGYMSCNHATVNTSLNNLNWNSSALAFDFRYGVEGYEAGGTGPAASFTLANPQVTDGSSGDWTPNLDAAFAAVGATQVKGSDVLVLRSSLPEVAPVYSSANTDGSGNISVNSPGALLVGQVAAISDCTKSIAFQISSVGNTVSFAGAVGPPGNAVTTLPAPFATGSLISPLTTSVYYIGVGSDGDTALKRLDLNGANGPGQFTDEELVPDIENMQVLYGVDTAGSTDPTLSMVPTEYLTADQVTDFGTVVSIKVALLAAGSPGSMPAVTQPIFNLLGTQVTAPRDNRARRVFEVTINLRNAVN